MSSPDQVAGTPQSKPKVLLCVTGSVAAVKAPRLAVLLREFAEVTLVKTSASEHFLQRCEAYDPEGLAAFEALSPPVPVLGDAEEWGSWERVGDPVLHVKLRDWADVMLVAPLSANTLAKLANGLCDNLLTSVARAWDFAARKPVVVAPAMNTHMWEHPLTAAHLEALRALGGVSCVPPVAKTLACGDVGVGGLAELSDISQAARAALVPGSSAP